MRCTLRAVGLRRRLAAFAAGLTWSAMALAQPHAAVLPTFAELEAAGATIGEIRVTARDIFDTADPLEDKLLFRWANKLHIQTRDGVVERALLFKTGERLEVRKLEETERLLRSNRYLYDVQIRPLAVHDGVVDIEVSTRDTWSLDPGISASRSGGANASSIGLREYNLFGTGITLGLGHSSNVDRSSNEFLFTNERVFGSWTAFSLNHASNSDGRRDAVSLLRPFYSLDARWAAGAVASRDDRIDSIYNAGNLASQYRHRESRGEVFGGWSRGLVDGWVQRWSAGVNLQDDRYAIEPNLAAPPVLPGDDKRVTPFVRYELLEDRYEREQNRGQIGRPEFFALGLQSRVQLGRAVRSLGSTRDAWVYSASVGRGFEPGPDQILLASTELSGQLVDGRIYRQSAGLRSRYYLPHHGRWVFYAAAGVDALTNPAINDELLLGGDDGLRGYPLRYQSGTRRALLTVEERYFTDMFVWRLFRIGGAAFVDVGRAWGGANANLSNPGWLSDAGVGLRIANSRAAFGNVLHIDLAFPLNATPDIKNVQLLVKTKLSF